MKSKALSVMQPWAWLIVHGYKDIENRKWKTSVRGQIYVHAGLRIDHEAYEMLSSVLTLPKKEDLKTGGIVGMTTITDCVSESVSPWFFGPYGFKLSNSKPLIFMPMKGHLGFFDAEYDLDKAVQNLTLEREKEEIKQ